MCESPANLLPIASSGCYTDVPHVKGGGIVFGNVIVMNRFYHCCILQNQTLYIIVTAAMILGAQYPSTNQMYFQHLSDPLFLVFSPCSSAEKNTIPRYPLSPIPVDLHVHPPVLGTPPPPLLRGKMNLRLKCQTSRERAKRICSCPDCPTPRQALGIARPESAGYTTSTSGIKV